MPEEKKRGGTRIGAGRPKGTTGIKKRNVKGTTRVVFQVSCQPEELAEIERLAEIAGLNKSKFILQKVLGK